MRHVWRSLALLLTFVGTGHTETNTVKGGRYLLSQRTVVVSPIPILPDLSSETWSVSLLDLSASPERLQGQGKVCQIKMTSSSSLVRTELPPALERLLSDVRLDARLVTRPTGTSIEQAPQVRVLGAKLRDAARERLPESAADPRVFDHDGDGRPGVTVRVRGIVNGEVFVVQRGSASLRGESDASGFHGTVQLVTDDVVLGATKSVLMTRTKAIPDPSRSTFVLRRVDQNLDCEGAVALAGRIH